MLSFGSAGKELRCYKGVLAVPSVTWLVAGPVRSVKDGNRSGCHGLSGTSMESAQGVCRLWSVRLIAVAGPGLRTGRAPRRARSCVVRSSCQSWFADGTLEPPPGLCTQEPVLLTRESVPTSTFCAEVMVGSPAGHACVLECKPGGAGTSAEWDARRDAIYRVASPASPGDGR